MTRHEQQQQQAKAEAKAAYFAAGGTVTKCPPAHTVSKYEDHGIAFYGAVGLPWKRAGKQEGRGN
jgi:hypothetical protein